MKKTGPATKTLSCPELKNKIQESKFVMTFFGEQDSLLY
jgi:hypothetical protein